MILPEVWFYIVSVWENMILIHIFKILNQFLSRIIIILTKENQNSGGSLVEDDMNLDYKVYEKFYGCYFKDGGMNIFCIFLLIWSDHMERKNNSLIF